MEIADEANLKATPTGMAPSSQAFLVPHPGYQTVLDAADPFRRAEIVDPSADPIGNREDRIEYARDAMNVLNEGEST